MRNRWPNEETEHRVKAALAGPGGEVLRTIIAQPKRAHHSPNFNPDALVPVPR